ncbi:hypothetical protein [Ralstonia pseudosolanacearum]|nr:hypothetical protein [Ralstonia pseudosolanacearum]
MSNHLAPINRQRPKEKESGAEKIKSENKDKSAAQQNPYSTDSVRLM